MNERTKEQNEALFGPSGYSEHAPGDRVQFIDGDELAESEVIFTRAAGPVASGKMLKAGHIVPGKRGWLRFVPAKDVVE